MNRKTQMTPMNSMKKLGKLSIGLALAVGIIGSASAQMQAVNSAEYSLFSNSLDELISAKEQIDKAAINPKTSQLPKMFIIKSMVYSRLYENRNQEILKPYATKAGYTSGEAMLLYINSAAPKKAELIETAKGEMGKAFISVLNESGELWESKDFNTIGNYYLILLPLYDNLDTATLSLLRNNKIERPFIVDRLVYCALNNKDKNAGMQLIKDLVAKGNTSPSLVEALSNNYIQQGDTISAEKTVREALDKSGNAQEYFQILMNFYIKTHQELKLMDDVSKQIAIDPNNSNLFYTRGYLYEMSNNGKKAIEDYKKAVEIDPANYNANFNLGLMIMKIDGKELYEKKAAAVGAKKKLVEEEIKMTFGNAKKYLEVALSNTEYSLTDQINICKGLKTACLEMLDNEGAKKYGDLQKSLEEELAAGGK